jgi:hypothetical protein
VADTAAAVGLRQALELTAGFVCVAAGGLLVEHNFLHTMPKKTRVSASPRGICSLVGSNSRGG